MKYETIVTDINVEEGWVEFNGHKVYSKLNVVVSAGMSTHNFYPKGTMELIE